MKLSNISNNTKKSQKKSLVNFSSDIFKEKQKGDSRTFPSINDNNFAKPKENIPKIAHLLYKVVFLRRVAKAFNSRISLKKPEFSKEDKLVFVNDMAYNSQKMEQAIFLKKYMEKNVNNMFFIIQDFILKPIKRFYYNFMFYLKYDKYFGAFLSYSFF